MFFNCGVYLGLYTIFFNNVWGDHVVELLEKLGVQWPIRKHSKSKIIVSSRDRTALLKFKLEITLTSQEVARKMMNSGILADMMSIVQVLLDVMVNEVICVTMEQKSRATFPDQVPWSYFILFTGQRFWMAKRNNLHVDGLYENGRPWAHIVYQDLCSLCDDATLHPN